MFETVIYSSIEKEAVRSTASFYVVCHGYFGEIPSNAPPGAIPCSWGVRYIAFSFLPILQIRTNSASELRFPQPLTPEGSAAGRKAREQNREAIFPSASCASRGAFWYRDCGAISYTRTNSASEPRLPQPLIPEGSTTGRKAREQNRVSDLRICERGCEASAYCALEDVTSSVSDAEDAAVSPEYFASSFSASSFSSVW